MKATIILEGDGVKATFEYEVEASLRLTYSTMSSGSTFPCLEVSNTICPRCHQQHERIVLTDRAALENVVGAFIIPPGLGTDKEHLHFPTGVTIERA